MKSFKKFHFPIFLYISTAIVVFSGLQLKLSFQGIHNETQASRSPQSIDSSIPVSPVPDFACFGRAVDVPDLRGEAIARLSVGSENTSAVNESLIAPQIHQVAQVLKEVNQGNSYLDMKLKDALDAQIKDLVLRLKVQAIADLAVNGLQTWPVRYPVFDASDTCSPWKSKIKKMLQVSQQAAEYRLKLMDPKSKSALRQLRIRTIISVFSQNKKEIERLAQLRKTLSRADIKEGVYSVSNAVVAGQEGLPPDFQTQLKQETDQRRKSIESQRQEMQKLEARLVSQNVFFEAPELFQPKGVLSGLLRFDFMGGNQTISIIEPSALFENLDSFLSRLNHPAYGESAVADWSLFTTNHFQELDKMFGEQYEKLYNQAYLEIGAACRENPENFYFNKPLVSMAASELLNSRRQQGVTRDGILRVYRPYCEYLSQEEIKNESIKQGLESLSVYGSSLGVVALALPVVSGTTALVSQTAAGFLRGALLGMAKREALQGVYRAVLLSSGIGFITALLSESGISLAINKYDLEIKNLFLLKDMARSASASETDKIKGQIADEILRIGEELSSKRTAVADAALIPATGIVFGVFTRVIRFVSDKASLLAIEKALGEFKTGLTSEEQTLRALYAAQQGIRVDQIGADGFNQWQASLAKSINAQGAPMRVIARETNPVVSQIRRKISSETAIPETRDLALAKERYLALVGETPTIGDLNLLTTWTDKNAIGIMTTVKRRAQVAMASGESEAVAWKKALKQEFGDDYLSLCSGGCNICPISIK